MPDTDWTDVRERVMALCRHADRDRVFGTNGHDMSLEPPLSHDDLGELEAALGVRLPEDYRGFLTQVGAGGAGPAYGAFPVRRKESGGWSWEGDGADLTEQEPVKMRSIPPWNCGNSGYGRCSPSLGSPVAPSA